MKVIETPLPNSQSQHLLLKNIKQVSAFIFDKDGKICLIQFPNKDYWSLPGGSPENIDNNFKETLIREINEEADLIVRDFERIGYIEGFPEINLRKNFNNLDILPKLIK